MTASQPTALQRFGLSAAISTPFTASFEPDVARLAEHARSLVETGCGSVTLFGTTGEGASLSLTNRAAMLGAVRGAGLSGRQVLAGITASALPDALTQANMALDFECRALMLTPPFYFKGQTDDMIFAWHARFIEGMKGRARDLILYHIPGVTSVGLSVELVGRLKSAFGDVIMGVKDSGGNWEHTSKLLAARAADCVILVGDERHLAAAVRAGGSGAISGLANVVPGDMARLIATGQDNPALTALVDRVCELPIMTAVKGLVALARGDAEWERMCAPLPQLDAAQKQALAAAWAGYGKAMAA